jgi:hypothetical protein
MFTAQDITVYVPFYKASKTIEACVDSLKKQSITFGRLLVVDDGSPEPLPMSLDVECLQHEFNRGLAAARNTALANCQTSLIAAVDADVVVEANWLEKLLETLNESGAAGVAARMDEHYQRNIGDRWRAIHMAQHWGDEMIENPRFLFGANTLYNVAALKDIGGFDETCRTNNEDRTVSEALYAAGYKLIYNPQVQCYHYKQDDVTTVLRAYWGWHHAKGVKEGDFKTVAGIISRVGRVNFGISQFRYTQDMDSGRSDLAVMDLLIPLVFCCCDLEFYQRTTNDNIFDLKDLCEQFFPGCDSLLADLLPTITGLRTPAEWHKDYLNNFMKSLNEFMTIENLKSLDLTSWLHENIYMEMGK